MSPPQLLRAVQKLSCWAVTPVVTGQQVPWRTKPACSHRKATLWELCNCDAPPSLACCCSGVLQQHAVATAAPTEKNPSVNTVQTKLIRSDQMISIPAFMFIGGFRRPGAERTCQQRSSSGDTGAQIIENTLKCLVTHVRASAGPQRMH